MHILLVEDSPADVRLTQYAFGESKIASRLVVVPDGVEAMRYLRRDGDVIRHFWGSEMFYAPTEPGQDPRHVGTLEPLWNFFDLTPEGRPIDWDEQLSYP